MACRACSFFPGGNNCNGCLLEDHFNADNIEHLMLICCHYGGGLAALRANLAPVDPQERAYLIGTLYLAVEHELQNGLENVFHGIEDVINPPVVLIIPDEDEINQDALFAEAAALGQMQEEDPPIDLPVAEMEEDPLVDVDFHVAEMEEDPPVDPAAAPAPTHGPPPPAPALGPPPPAPAPAHGPPPPAPAPAQGPPPPAPAPAPAQGPPPPAPAPAPAPAQGPVYGPADIPPVDPYLYVMTKASRPGLTNADLNLMNQGIRYIHFCAQQSILVENFNIGLARLRVSYLVQFAAPYQAQGLPMNHPGAGVLAYLQEIVYHNIHFNVLKAQAEKTLLHCEMALDFLIVRRSVLNQAPGVQG